jgi:hypothetical protein
VYCLVCAGFMVGKKAEAGGIAKDGAKMVMAVANVKVGPEKLPASSAGRPASCLECRRCGMRKTVARFHPYT